METRNFRFSRIISFILHPLLIPSIATLILLLRPDIYPIVLPGNLKIWFISLIFAFTFIIPSAAVLILLKLNKIYSVELNNRSERTVPLLISGFSYLALLFIIKPSGIPPVFLYVLYSATFALLAGLLINLAYKISLHTLGWGALSAMLMSISIRMGIPLLSIIISSVILSGIVGYARLNENAHNQTQVYLGYIAGVCIVILITYFS